MEHFLQKVSSKQDQSHSNYNQQSIFQELKVMQQENFKILRKVKELEGKYANLMFNIQILKNENFKPVNLRDEQIKFKFNQLVELTESLFLKNTAANDPMDVEPNLQPAKISIVKNRKQCQYSRN